SIEEFAAQTRAKMAHADIALVVVDDDLAPFIEPRPGDPAMVLFSELLADVQRLAIAPSDMEAAPQDPDRLAVLQFTSGSTADPKGVMLPNRTICANLDAIAIAAELDVDDDCMVSWLPLYHDMGLVGFAMLPMSTGVDVVIGAPQDFLGAPLRWLEWLSTFGGTATAGPNFSWVLATRAHRAERGRARRPRHRRGLRRRCRRAQDASGRGVPRFRDGGGRDRCDVPRADGRPAGRQRGPARPRDRALCRARRAR